jgi:matrixin
MNATFVKRAALVLAGGLVVSAASAYVLLSPRRTWDTVPNLIVDNRGNPTITDSDHGVSRTVAAINSNSAWNGAGTGTRVNATAGSVSGWRLGDGRPMLSFADPAHGCKGTCLAATFTGYYSQRSDGTYRIDDADIVTNTKPNFTTTAEPDGCSGEYYIEGVMVHEVGHLIGLAHTNVSGATMYPSVSSCNNNPATIENDDKAGVQDLY